MNQAADLKAPVHSDSRTFQKTPGVAEIWEERDIASFDTVGLSESENYYWICININRSPVEEDEAKLLMGDTSKEKEINYPIIHSDFFLKLRSMLYLGI